MYKILVVCTGNICRSPMGEGFIREMLSDDLKQIIEVTSAGTHASEGNEAMDYSVQNMNSFGIDISMHRSRKLTYEMIKQADLILVMDNEQKKIVGNCLEDQKKVKLLSDFAPHLEVDRIDDPFGGTKNTYDTCAFKIRECCKGVLEFIKRNIASC